MNRTQRFIANVDRISRKRAVALEMQDAAYFTVPYAYCTLVMALREYTDMTDEDIIYIVERSYKIWDQMPYDPDVDPLDICEKETGISLKGYVRTEEKK